MAGTRIDMTPMVDLGFLLITFFVFTSSMTETMVLRLYMPADGRGTEVSDQHVISFVVGDQEAYAYEGDWYSSLAAKQVKRSSLSPKNLGDIIMKKREGMKDKDMLVALIKPMPSASYGDVVNMLDAMMIYEVTRYAIVEPTFMEIEYASRQ